MRTNKPLTGPNNEAAEKNLLGALLIDPSMFLIASTMLEADDFFLVRHQYIWQAMEAISDREEEIDYITLTAQLEADGRHKDIGGSVYLTQMSAEYDHNSTVDTAIMLIRDMSMRRKLLGAAEEITKNAFDLKMPADEVYTRANRLIDSVNNAKNSRYVPGSRSIAAYDDIQTEISRKNASGEVVTIPLPDDWEALRKIIPEVYTGHLTVITGPSGAGKSAKCETWAEYAAQCGIPTEYIPTEMGIDDVLHRRMARYSGLPYSLLKSGQLEAEAWKKCHEADEAIMTWQDNLSYNYQPDVKFTVLARELRMAVAQGKKLIFIDHFQDISPDFDTSKGTNNRQGPKTDNDTRKLEFICTWLAAFAEKWQIHLVVASQENKDGDVMWTKKLTQKAVNWFAIRRDRLDTPYSYYLDGKEVYAAVGEDSPLTTILVKKSRAGKKGRAQLFYAGPRFLYVGLTSKLIKVITDDSEEGGSKIVKADFNQKNYKPQSQKDLDKIMRDYHSRKGAAGGTD